MSEIGTFKEDSCCRGRIMIGGWKACGRIHLAVPACPALVWFGLEMVGLGRVGSDQGSLTQHRVYWVGSAWHDLEQLGTSWHRLA